MLFTWLLPPAWAGFNQVVALLGGGVFVVYGVLWLLMYVPGYKPEDKWAYDNIQMAYDFLKIGGALILLGTPIFAGLVLWALYRIVGAVVGGYQILSSKGKKNDDGERFS